MDTRITLFIICFTAIMTIRRFVLHPDDYIPTDSTTPKWGKHKSKKEESEERHAEE